MKKSKAATTKRAKAQSSAASKNVRSGNAAQLAAGNSANNVPLIAKQPQSKQQAAASGGMFLYTHDAWSLAYFDKNDLHCRERVLFG